MIHHHIPRFQRSRNEEARLGAGLLEEGLVQSLHQEPCAIRLARAFTRDLSALGFGCMNGAISCHLPSITHRGESVKLFFFTSSDYAIRQGMTDLHPLLFIMAALAAAGFVMHRFGLKPALGALAAAGAVGLALFRGRRAMGAVTAPPPARGAPARLSPRKLRPSSRNRRPPSAQPSRRPPKTRMRWPPRCEASSDSSARLRPCHGASRAGCGGPMTCARPEVCARAGLSPPPAMVSRCRWRGLAGRLK